MEATSWVHFKDFTLSLVVIMSKKFVFVVVTCDNHTHCSQTTPPTAHPTFLAWRLLVYTRVHKHSLVPVCALNRTHTPGESWKTL